MFQCFQNSPPLQNQFAHADQVLGDLGEALLAFVSQEAGPVNQVLVDLLQSFLVVLTEFHLQNKRQIQDLVLVVTISQWATKCWGVMFNCSASDFKPAPTL